MCALSTVLTPILCFISLKIKVERIKERVEEKEGIPPQQQRLIYSGKQMWVCPSTAEPSLAKNCLPISSPFNTPSLLFVFFQERWEDGCGLQDPRRLSAPPRAGAKRRLVAPPALHIPPLVLMSCSHHGRGHLSAIALDVGHSPTVSQHSRVARCQADLKTR